MKASLLLQARVALGLVVLLAIGWRGQTAAALTPESPQVKAAIARAIKFLESDAATDGRVGAKALVGLVMLKNHADRQTPADRRSRPRHPSRRQRPRARQDQLDGHIYTAGLSVIFLATLDPARLFQRNRLSAATSSSAAEAARRLGISGPRHAATPR